MGETSEMTGDTVTAIVVGATVAVAGVGCTAAWGTEETVGVSVATKTESKNKDKKESIYILICVSSGFIHFLKKRN